MQQGSWRTTIHYPYEHLAYVRETETEQILVTINFSYEKELSLDEKLKPGKWQVLLSTDYKPDIIIDLPQILKPFESSIFKRC